MTSFVMDSWAWVEYLRGSKAGQLIKRDLDSGSELLTNAISLADDFVLQTARKHDCRILTGDIDFEGLKEARILA